jgi:hypothetical protein
MKKLIAVLAMCILITGMAFAETTLTGKIFLGGQLLNGTNNKYVKHPGTGAIAFDNYNSVIGLTFGGGDAGGKLSLHNLDGGPTAYDWFGYWRPIPQLRIQMGVNADGDFGTAQITGWGFTGEAKNGLGALGEYSGPIFGLAHARTGFYGGTGETPNLQFSIFPAEGLTVNFWLPFEGENFASTITRFHLNVKYAIPDIGTATLSYQSDTGYLKGDSPFLDYGEESWWGTKTLNGTPKVFLSFYLTAIENMGVDLGLAYKFPLVVETDVTGGTNTSTKNYPFEIGLGYRFASGDLGFKLRAAFSIGESTEQDSTVSGYKKPDPVEAPTLVSVNILPSYNIGSNIIAYFYAGMGIKAVKDWEKPIGGTGSVSYATDFTTNKDNSVVSWFINPYVLIKAGDSLRFQVGFQVYSDGIKYSNGDPALINWAIPFGFYSYF